MDHKLTSQNKNIDKFSAESRVLADYILRIFSNLPQNHQSEIFHCQGSSYFLFLFVLRRRKFI